MSTTDRTARSREVQLRIAASARLNTAAHQQASQNRKYLQMKAAQAANPSASCKNCNKCQPRQYVFWCLMWSHVVKAGNICEEYKA